MGIEKIEGEGRYRVMDRKKLLVSICPGVLKIGILNFAYSLTTLRFHFSQIFQSSDWSLETWQIFIYTHFLTFLSLHCPGVYKLDKLLFMHTSSLSSVYIVLEFRNLTNFYLCTLPHFPQFTLSWSLETWQIII